MPIRWRRAGGIRWRRYTLGLFGGSPQDQADSIAHFNEARAWTFDGTVAIKGIEATARSTLDDPGAPADIRDTAGQLLGFLRFARKAIKQGRADEAARWALEAGELHRELLQRHFIDREITGRSRKRRRSQWAEVVAESLAADGGTAEKIWDSLPESFEPEEVDGDRADYRYYRDGGAICCDIKDGEGERSRALTKSTFLKNYLRPALRKRRNGWNARA